MMRQASLRYLRSTKNPSKSKSFRLQNVIETTTASKVISPNRSLRNTRSHTMLWSLTRQLQHYTSLLINSLLIEKKTRRLHTQHLSSPEEFKVRRSKPELLGPAKPTPLELKPLSNIDDQDNTRCLVPFVHFYRYNPLMEGKDPVKVILEALADALVFYYPLAGRITEGPDGRLSVDCTGEGVLFVEADADVELAQLGDPPRPPFPWLEKFLQDDHDSIGILDSPLFLIQVTRLKCGGFVFAFWCNHIISDARGFAQFFIAVGEIAQGAQAPSVMPIWRRELLSAPNPQPKICTSRDGIAQGTQDPFHDLDLIHRSFVFGPVELSAIRRLVPDHLLPYSTTFEILTAFLWRCRTIALEFDPEDTVRLQFPVNARDKTNRTIPAGYYGNAVKVIGISTSARQLCEDPIEYALGLVKQAKERGFKEGMSWRANPPAKIGDELYHAMENCFLVTDMRRIGFDDVDFGWGKAAYAGMAKIEFDPLAVYVPFRDQNGEDGSLVHLCLEGKAMGRFECEVNNLLTVK